MTTDRDKLREALERADKAATPGPWYRLDPPWISGDVETTIMAESPDPHVARFICDFDFAGMFDEDDGKKSECPDADADLILVLRNNLPTILAALSTDPEQAVMAEREADGWERGMRDAANICATLSETTYDDADAFEAAAGCEAVITAHLRSHQRARAQGEPK